MGTTGLARTSPHSGIARGSHEPRSRVGGRRPQGCEPTMVGKANHRGFGHVRRLPSKRWQASYQGPDLPRHSAPNTIVTKVGAEGWLATERALISEGRWSPVALRRSGDSGSVRLEQYASGWLQERRLKPRTREGYEHLLQRIYSLPSGMPHWRSSRPLMCGSGGFPWMRRRHPSRRGPTRFSRRFSTQPLPTRNWSAQIGCWATSRDDSAARRARAPTTSGQLRLSRTQLAQPPSTDRLQRRLSQRATCGWAG